MDSQKTVKLVRPTYHEDNVSENTQLVHVEVVDSFPTAANPIHHRRVCGMCPSHKPRHRRRLRKHVTFAIPSHACTSCFTLHHACAYGAVTMRFAARPSLLRSQLAYAALEHLRKWLKSVQAMCRQSAARLPQQIADSDLRSQLVGFSLHAPQRVWMENIEILVSLIVDV